jgi:hypothetical protein
MRTLSGLLGVILRVQESGFAECCFGLRHLLREWHFFWLFVELGDKTNPSLRLYEK